MVFGVTWVRAFLWKGSMLAWVDTLFLAEGNPSLDCSWVDSLASPLEVVGVPRSSSITWRTRGLQLASGWHNNKDHACLTLDLSLFSTTLLLLLEAGFFTVGIAVCLFSTWFISCQSLKNCWNGTRFQPPSLPYTKATSEGSISFKAISSEMFTTEWRVICWIPASYSPLHLLYPLLSQGRVSRKLK